ncbi:MAG: ATP-binding cassette domain-containing protein [Planctomycetes bacterium]|nr:ATP-binding cassette domain-containing protein [Planctomycetota bacterium]
MDPLLIAADDTQRAPGGRFRTHEFVRILSLAWPFHRKLAAGILLSIAFAALQTVGIGVVFPVFTILLEPEGLHGWAHRALAGHRLGVEFSPPSPRGTVRILKLHSGPGEAARLQAGDILTGADGGAAEFLRGMAEGEAGATITALVNPGPEQRLVELAPAPLERHFRALRWAMSRLPSDVSQDRIRTLLYVLAALVLAAVSGNVCRYFGEVLIAKAILSALMVLRERLYERTLRLPMRFFAGQPTADIVTRFVQDIQEIQRGLITLFGRAIREPLRAVFVLVWAFFLDWRVTLTMAVVGPLAVAVFWTVGRSVKKANHRLLQAYGAMIGALTASLHNLRVVKAYTAEAYEEQRLNAVDLRMFKQQARIAMLDAFVGPMMETLGVLAGSLVTVWFANLVLRQEMTPSLFMTLGVTLSALFDPLRKLSDVYVRIQRSTAGAERIFQVIDQPVERPLSAGGTELGALGRSIQYLHVTFTYPGAAGPALSDINLEIRRGETLALVGPNGCGKTTLVSMLLRLFDPDVGQILYDGVDLRQAALPSLRRQIGLVSQEAVVFGGTPLENIAYGSMPPEGGPPDEALRQRVEQAARRAYADEFIRGIPGGYDANLGERGTTLSGGQRQRLAIARAIFRDAPILVFDEATSQIDSESELKIQTALTEFARGRTTIIIAHRLSTIQFAQRVVVMDAGRVVDSGGHREVYDRCALYRTLCDTQLADGAGSGAPSL